MTTGDDAPRVGGLERAAYDLLARPALSRTWARLADLRLPGPLMRAVIRRWIAGFGVDMDEAARPVEDYDTLDDFFTRALRPGARPIDPEPGALLSCADGRLSHIGPLDASSVLQAKGHTYTVDALLAEPGAGAVYDGGFAYTVYLSPRDYHRVHCPVAGEVTGYRHVPGRLYPVHDRSRSAVEGLFCRNERLVVDLTTPHGRAAAVFVGATFVGRISATFADVRTNRAGATAVAAAPLSPPVPYAAGDHLGTFHMGSTVVVLHERAHRPAADFELGDAVRVGQRIATPVDDAA